MKYFEYLDLRKNTFKLSYELMCSFINDKNIYNIVELGSSRSYVDFNYEGCCNSDISYWNPYKPIIWDWGAGIFTKVFSDNLLDKNFKLYTIDPNINANIIVKNMCETDKVVVIRNTSTDFLKKFDKKINFLYMDHLEYDINNVEDSENSALTHLNDIKIILDRKLMDDNGLILIDDVSNIGGKGKYSIPFLLENGYEILKHEYQVLLKKK